MIDFFFHCYVYIILGNLMAKTLRNDKKVIESLIENYNIAILECGSVKRWHRKKNIELRYVAIGHFGTITLRQMALPLTIRHITHQPGLGTALIRVYFLAHGYTHCTLSCRSITALQVLLQSYYLLDFISF